MSESSRRVQVNGVATEVGSSELATLLVELGIAASRPGVAVALDGAVVPRRQWATTPVADGQSIEIVTARQGG